MAKIKQFLALLRRFYQRHPMLPLIIPAALLIYFVYVALGWNLWVSVSDWPARELTASYGWGGFQWYGEMFKDDTFWLALKNTLLLFSIIPICLIIGLLLALLMDQGLKGTGLFRTLILLPFALSYVVTGTVWVWMYEPSYGVINSLLDMLNPMLDQINSWLAMVNIESNLHIKTLDLQWLARQESVMPSIIIALVWQFSGYVALIFYAGIKSVPQNVINAAKLDGAYSIRIYLKLVLPALKGSLSSSVTILAMYALRSFDFIWQLTEGGPGTASHTLPVMMYRQTFQQNNYAYGAAISNFLLVLVLVLILPITYLSNRKKA